jgi:acyl-CoA thioesterase-1
MSRRAAAILIVVGLAGGLLAGCSSATAPTPTTSATLVADPTVVTIGDSIMKGHGLSASQAWPALMAAQDHWRLDNLACDGAGFLAVGDDSDCAETFSGLVRKAAALHPRTVIVEGSSNDFGQDDDDLLYVTVDQLAQLRKALPHAQIIGLSTVWGDTAAPAQLMDVDDQVRDAVEQVGGRFLSIGQPLSGHPEWMQPDDVHPTAAGQLALYAAVQTAFTKAGVRA